MGYRIINTANIKRGEALPQTKLTHDQVREIRSAQAEYMELRRRVADLSAQGLAWKYGVSRDTIFNIWKREYWDHI